MTGRADRSLRHLSAYRLRRASVAVMSEFNEVFAAFGLRRTTFSALALIVDNPGLRQSQLADALAIERPNLVQIVDELERAGLVRRKTAENDRRAYALQPTAAGRRLQAEAMAAALRKDAELTCGLTAEQIDGFHKVLKTIQENARSGEDLHVYDVSRA